jgi:hypothetical protein
VRFMTRKPAESIATGAARWSGGWSDMESVASVAFLVMVTRVLRLTFAACPLGAWPDKHPAHRLYGAIARAHQQKAANGFNGWFAPKNGSYAMLEWPECAPCDGLPAGTCTAAWSAVQHWLATVNDRFRPPSTAKRSGIGDDHLPPTIATS